MGSAEGPMKVHYGDRRGSEGRGYAREEVKKVEMKGLGGVGRGVKKEAKNKSTCKLHYTMQYIIYISFTNSAYLPYVVTSRERWVAGGSLKHAPT